MVHVGNPAREPESSAVEYEMHGCGIMLGLLAVNGHWPNHQYWLGLAA